jgi:hypothetical protein
MGQAGEPARRAETRVEPALRGVPTRDGEKRRRGPSRRKVDPGVPWVERDSFVSPQGRIRGRGRREGRGGPGLLSSGHVTKYTHARGRSWVALETTTSPRDVRPPRQSVLTETTAAGVADPVGPTSWISVAGRPRRTGTRPGDSGRKPPTFRRGLAGRSRGLQPGGGPSAAAFRLRSETATATVSVRRPLNSRTCDPRSNASEDRNGKRGTA